MKKIVYSAIAVFLAAGLFAGCGDEQKKEQEQQLPLSQLDVDKYVTLGDYNNLSVSTAPAEVNQTQLEQLMLEVYSSYLTEDIDGVTDRVVEAGDVVNIDYEGKLDGVAFAGGTDSGALLSIGSGMFIDGFEDGLMGVMPGETIDLDMSFPDPYPNNPSLAGQPVVFTVTVNFIVPVDELIPRMEIEGVTTAEEFRQYTYDYLYELAQEDYRMELQNAIIEALIAQCQYESLPEYMLKQTRETLRENLQNAAAQIGITSEMLVSSYYNGMSVEDFLETYAAEGVKQNLALQAIANREGLALDDEELQSLLEAYASIGGYSSVEEFLEDVSREDFRNYFMSERVIEFLAEKVMENQ